MKKINEEDSKKRILTAAIKLFAKHGFDGVSIREICKEASINICMISYYFGGKKELYEAIIDDLIEKQTKYVKTFLNFDKKPQELTKKEQIELLFFIIDKFIDFFYANISKDLIILLLKEQQNRTCSKNSPSLNYLRTLIACVFNKDENDREIIFKTLFILSQINSAKILPAFSLHLLKQEDFSANDIEIIKNNARFYITSSLRESGIV